MAGHTRGHLGVVIDTGGEGNGGSRRWLVHAGDAYFNHGQLEREPSIPPFLTVFQSLLQADRTTRVHNLSRLNELALNGEADVFCAHDQFELDRARASHMTGTEAGPLPQHTPQE